MGSFGERMQREREMRGISLDEIAASTKISSRSLRAIEQEDFSKLPGGIFNRGFVRSYARFLGIDEEQAVTEFIAAEQERRADDAGRHPLLGDEAAPPQPRKLPQWAFLAAIVLALAALLVGWQYRERFSKSAAQAQGSSPLALPEIESAQAASLPADGDAQQNAEPAPELTAQNAAAKPVAQKAESQKTSEVNSAAAAADVPPAAPPLRNSPISLEIRTRGESWVSVSADGRTMLEGVLSAQSVRSFRAREQMVVKVGNAGGVEISHNGLAVAGLGSEGEVKTFTFTPEGLQR